MARQPFPQIRRKISREMYTLYGMGNRGMIHAKREAHNEAQKLRDKGLKVRVMPFKTEWCIYIKEGDL